MKPVAYFAVLFVALNIASAADEIPAQFSAWGTRGPELPPLPAGWTEVRAETRASEMAKPSEKESAAGLILFQRATFAEIYHDTIPAEHEHGANLRTFAAQGEYEPLTFAFHALEDLKSCAVKIGELKNQNGA